MPASGIQNLGKGLKRGPIGEDGFKEKRLNTASTISTIVYVCLVLWTLSEESKFPEDLGLMLRLEYTRHLIAGFS